MYIEILRAIKKYKPTTKPMWSVDGNKAYGIDDLDLAKVLTIACYNGPETPSQSFKVLKNRECASRIQMIPSNVEFVIYNEKAS